MAIAFVSAALTVVLPWHAVAVGAGVFAVGAGAIAPLSRFKSKPHPQESEQEEPAASPSQEAEPQPVQESEPSSITPGVSRRLYRKQELARVVASLKANSSILIAGGQGSGKSVLGTAVVSQLEEEGFTVVSLEPATPKQMLVEMAMQLGVAIVEESLETNRSRSLTAEQLKPAIAIELRKQTAFVVLDDAHLCELKFRNWLRTLERQSIPLLLLATDPPKTDIFISIPRIELGPLPEYAIREVMEQAALERGLNLKISDLARLQQRAGGNPALAIRAINEEYLGLEPEAGDHRRYIDGTPLLLLLGIGFIVLRFIGLGTSNQTLYIFGGIAAAVFMGVSRLLYALPPDSRRIQS